MVRGNNDERERVALRLRSSRREEIAGESAIALLSRRETSERPERRMMSSPSSLYGCWPLQEYINTDPLCPCAAGVQL